MAREKFGIEKVGGTKRTVSFDKDLDQKIRNLQAHLISCNEKQISFSRTMNYLIRKAFEKGGDDEILITLDKRLERPFPQSWK